MLKRRPHVALALLSCVTLLSSACAPEEPPAPPSETEVAPGWVLSRPFPQVQSLQDVVTLSPTRAYAVGTGAALLRYDESSWTLEDAPSDLDASIQLESVSGVLDEESGAELVLAVGAAGTVLRRDEAGWTRLESGSEAHLFGVWVRSLDDAFIVGDDGTILRLVEGAVVSMDAEAAQTRDLDDGTTELYRIPESLKAVAGGGGVVWAVGQAGSVYVYPLNAEDPAARRWVRDVSHTSRPFTDVFTRAGVWATATDGILFRRHDEANEDGKFWVEERRIPVPLYLQGMWASGGDDLYTVGMAGAVFHFDGAEWVVTELDEEAHMRAIDGVYEVIPSEDEEPEVRRTVFAVGAGGRILRGPTARPSDDRSETEQGS